MSGSPAQSVLPLSLDACAAPDEAKPGESGAAAAEDASRERRKRGLAGWMDEEEGDAANAIN